MLLCMPFIRHTRHTRTILLMKATTSHRHIN
uniref:Uncharacterized protein n=1 Tax=Arundo donax TaxID=35708 RepID=A0A0A9FWT0_ARUDO